MSVQQTVPERTVELTKELRKRLQQIDLELAQYREQLRSEGASWLKCSPHSELLHCNILDVGLIALGPAPTVDEGCLVSCSWVGA